MTPPPSESPDLIELIAWWLGQDDAISAYVGGRIGALGEHDEAPSHVEIGLTKAEPTVDAAKYQHLATIHLWSRSGSPEELQEILRAAELAITSRGEDLNPEREFTEVRFDEEHGEYHGLLRLNLRAAKAIQTPAEK